MYCSKCGYEIQDDAVFCMKCGARTGLPQYAALSSSPQGAYGSGENPAFSPPPQQGACCSGDNQAYSPALQPDIAEAEQKSIASLVMGIIGIVACFLCAGLVTGPLAMARGKEARLVLDSRNYNFHIALAGVITGAVGLAFSIFFAVYWTFFGTIIGGLFGGLFKFARRMFYNC